MAMWTCPHCGAAQTAASRCWVCRRSSTTCSTCRHFRTALAADVGWCALDRRRRPLTGLELRGCWTEQRTPTLPAAARAAAARAPASPGSAWRDLPVRDFVPVEGPAVRQVPGETDAPSPAGLPLVAVDPPDAWDGRVSLFGDAER